jgi:hypothetical protein
MEEAPENGKESSPSAHAFGMNKLLNYSSTMGDLKLVPRCGIFALLGCQGASIGSLLPMFPNNLSTHVKALSSPKIILGQLGP